MNGLLMLLSEDHRPVDETLEVAVWTQGCMLWIEWLSRVVTTEMSCSIPMTLDGASYSSTTKGSESYSRKDKSYGRDGLKRWSHRHTPASQLRACTVKDEPPMPGRSKATQELGPSSASQSLRAGRDRGYSISDQPLARGKGG